MEEKENVPFLTLLMKIPSTQGTKKPKSHQPKQSPENQRISSQTETLSKPSQINNNYNKYETAWQTNMPSVPQEMKNKMMTWNNQVQSDSLSNLLNNNNNNEDPMWKNTLSTIPKSMKMTSWNEQDLMPFEEIHNKNSWNRVAVEEQNQWTPESPAQFNGAWNSQDISDNSASNEGWNDQYRMDNNQNAEQDLNMSQWTSDLSSMDMDHPEQTNNETSSLDMELELRVN
jgi:hypothetical protein